MERLHQQIQFIVEIDKVKNIFRRTHIMDNSRRENDAEHSWHLALMAMILSEHGIHESYDIFRVLKMVLVHDLVEIDAGDTFCYDVDAHCDKEEREQKAAERIFGLLPSDQKEEVCSLWCEFEERKTPEAIFAAALDRMQPLLCNFQNDGGTWPIYGVKYHQVIERNGAIEQFSPALWTYFKERIDEAVKKGILKKD